MKSNIMDYFKNIQLESVIQYIEGVAEPSVQAIVEEWIHSDEFHAAFFEKIKSAWLDLENLKNFDSDTVNSDWQYVLNEITKVKRIRETNPEAQHRTPRRFSWIRAAAIILILVSVGGSYFIGHYFSQKSNAEAVVYSEMVVPKGEKSQLVLSDGTKIWVNAGSVLRFPNKFGDKIREVWLDGEAFFEVAKNKAKPFFVRTSDLNIKVWGTSFNVKAYKEDNIIETSLIEGLVSLEQTVKGGKPGKEVFLQPNHKAIYLKNETSVITDEIKKEVNSPLKAHEIIISKPVHTELSASWKDGKLIFDDESFENIVKKLELKYGVNITLEDSSIKAIHYTGVLRNVSVEQAIRAIQLTADFRFTIKGNQINIYKQD